MKAMSCATALINAVEDYGAKINENNEAFLVYIKTFDKILLQKLQKLFFCTFSTSLIICMQ